MPAPGLVDRGTLLRGVLTDMGSPITYGYAINQLPIYFSGGVILDAGVAQNPEATPQSKIDALRPGSRSALSGAAIGGGGFGRGGGASIYQNTTPMATWVEHSQWDPNQQWKIETGAAAPAAGGGFGGGGRAGATTVLQGMGPRVIVQFPASRRDLLLSGVLGGGEQLSNRPLVVDSPIGQGHIVMFTMRPMWRWQTQGTFIMGLNAIMHWNDLSAGQAVMKETLKNYASRKRGTVNDCPPFLSDRSVHDHRVRG